MGTGSFTHHDWDNFETTFQVKSTPLSEVFGKVAKPEFNPVNFGFRESCETAEKPIVTPIIVALDVTGSMQMIPADLIRGRLASLMEKIMAERSIPNPHIMFMAVGDVVYDKSPLQVTQFEADIRIAEQLKDFWLEGKGGPNNSESYSLAWHFAATRTKLDSFTNRGEKGIIFTLGDEYAPTEIEGRHLQKFLGGEQTETLTTVQILANAQKSYDVFHLGIAQGNAWNNNVKAKWQDLLGQRLIEVDNYQNVDQIIVSTIVNLLAERKQMQIHEQVNARQHMASRAAALLNMGGIGSIHAMRQQVQNAEPPPPLYDDVVEADHPMRMGTP
jgi:hypothetical protein